MELPEIGYTKDFIATFGFVAFAYLIYTKKDLNKLKNFLLISTLAGFIVDGCFSLNPKFHCMKVGINTPSIVFFIGGFLLFIWYIYFLIKE